MPRPLAATDDGMAAVMVRVRAYLIRRAEETIVGLTQCDIYDFSDEQDRQLNRLADLKAGRPTHWYGWQLPAEVQPVDRAKLYTVTDTSIVPATIT